MDAKPILFAALLTISVAPKGVTAVAAQAGSEQGPWGVIQGYWFGCHNSKARVCSLALDSSSPDHLAEDPKDSFDSHANGLQLSAAFVDQYIAAAREIAREDMGDGEAPPVTTTYGDVANMVSSLPPRGDPGTGREQHHIEGMPFGTRGGFGVKHTFPVDDEYELTIGDMALAREVPRMEFENTVLALLDGKEIYRTNIGGEPDHKAIDQRLDPA